jgi:hypothetical protein
MNSTRRTPFWSQKTVARLSIFLCILNTHKSCSNDAIGVKLTWNTANGQPRMSVLRSAQSVDLRKSHVQTVSSFWMTFVNLYHYLQTRHKGEEEVQLYPFSTVVLEWDGWSAPRPVHFTNREDTLYPWYRWLGGPQGWSGWKIVPHQGLNTGPSSP